MFYLFNLQATDIIGVGLTNNINSNSSATEWMDLLWFRFVVGSISTLFQHSDCFRFVFVSVRFVIGLTSNRLHWVYSCSLNLNKDAGFLVSNEICISHHGFPVLYFHKNEFPGKPWWTLLIPGEPCPGRSW